MTAHLAHIVRHPVKSVGHEELAEAALIPGAALPWDRHWAVTHDATGAIAGWAPKRMFLRGVAAAELMAVACRLDPASGALSLTHPRIAPITLHPDTPEGAAALAGWLRPLWPTPLPAPAEVIHVPGQAMSDRPEPFVSLLNLASLRDLGAAVGRDLSIHRWRGNLWLDGLAPWAEFDLIGREITIGPARLRIEQRITRCAATSADPATGVVDIDMPAALEAARGHRDFGVYATILTGGTIRPGDEVLL